jgi:PAS domain-containing protein
MSGEQVFFKQSDLSELKMQAEEVGSDNKIVSIMNAIPDLAFVLNRKGEAVFVNKATIDWLKRQRGDEQYLGLRPGELVRCFISKSNVCGRHEACLTCGSRKGVIQSSEGVENRQDFIIYHEDGDALYYHLSASPLKGFSQNYSFVVLKDKVHEKRRYELEKIFFQNLLKTAGNLTGYAQLLKVTPVENKEEYADLICTSSSQLMHEIKSIRDLSAAERGQLILENEKIDSEQLIGEVVLYFKKSGYSSFEFQVKVDNKVQLIADKRLVIRILNHMIYNALEASEEGDSIKIECYDQNDDVCFSVNNKSVIPSVYQPQIFQRTFSSKSEDRGLGTYHIKLLGEKYLKGKVNFTSNKENGTTFYLYVPREREL